jgi:hypothetical protein
MRHRSLTLVVTIALLLAGSTAAVTVGASSHATVELTGPESVEPGDTVTVTASIDTDTPVYGVQFRLSLSTSVSGSVEKGDFLAGNASSVVVVREVSDRTVRYGETRTGADDGVTGSGTLARIELTVPESTDADQLDLSFETVKVSDPNAQPVNASGEGLSMTIGAASDDGSDADDGAGGGGGGGGGGAGAGGGGGGGGAGDGETTTATAPTTDAWPASVSASVVERFETADRVPVVVTVDPDADPAAVAERLESGGATEVQVHGDLNAVSATVSQETLRSVASRDDVIRVQYGSPAPPTATGDGSGGTPTPAGTDAADSTPAPEPTPTPTPAAGTTSTQFDLFGQPSIPLAVVVAGFLWWRRRLQ